MAELDNTRTPVIKIGTTEAVQNVKDLRDNIKGLRDEIVALSNSEEQNANTAAQIADAEKRLIQSQQELNRIMGITKQGTDGVSGSYNRLKAELRETKQQMDALPKFINGELNPAWDALATRYKELNNQAKAYDFELGNFQRNVGNYGNALSSLGQGMQQVRQVGGNMANGFAAISGVMNVAGASTAGFDEELKNVRTTLGIVQGAKGLAGAAASLGKFVSNISQATKAAKENTKASNKAAGAATQQAAATETLATAETHASVAGNILRGVLASLGIGLVIEAIGVAVAHIQDIVAWVTRLGQKLGIVSKENVNVKKAVSDLNDALDTNNRQTEHAVTLATAQGRSEREILAIKQENIRKSLEQAQATKKEIEARITQIKADARWWKFWQGTRGKLKEAEAALKEVNDTIKELSQNGEDINIDIQAAGIKEARENAKKAAKEAEEAAKKALELVKSGSTAAAAVSDVLLPEIDKINAKWDATDNLINSAVTATKELIKAGKDVTANTKTLAILEKGLKDSQTARQKETEDYYRKKFEEKTARQVAEISRQYEYGGEAQKRIYEYAQKVLGISKEEFGYLNAAGDSFNSKFMINQEMREALLETGGLFDTLGTSVKKMYDAAAKSGSIRDFDAFISSLSESVEGAYKLSVTNPEEYAKKFSEPVATAIKMLRENLVEFRSLRFDEEIIGVYDRAAAGLKMKMDNGEWAAAFNLVDTLQDTINENLTRLGTDGLDEKVQKRLRNVGQQYYKEILEGLADDNKMDTSKSLKLAWKIAEQLIPESTEGYLRKRIKAISQVLNNFTQAYASATSNALGSVADAWEESLKAQGKTNEKAFNGVKALQYAAAVINTSAAVVQALSDPTTPSYYLKAANAAAALAAGTAQVLQIKNTKLGGSTSSSSSAPKLVDRTPQLQYTYGINPADFAQAQAAYPIRAFVVDRDLKAGIENYDTRLRETTF